MDKTNESTYVTFKWLIGTTISSLVLVVSIMGIVASLVSSALNTKVNFELYNAQYKSQCDTIDAIKIHVTDNGKLMEKFNQNQLLVLRALKIDPVR